jgi:hypothetical protein
VATSTSPVDEAPRRAARPAREQNHAEPRVSRRARDRQVLLLAGLYQTKPGETPASTPYIDCDQRGRHERARSRCRPRREGERDLPELVLDNRSGLLDDLREDVIVDGYECEFYLGDPSWARRLPPGRHRQSPRRWAGRATRSGSASATSACCSIGELVGNELGGTGPNADEVAAARHRLRGEHRPRPDALRRDSRSTTACSRTTRDPHAGRPDVREGGRSLCRAPEVWTSVNTTCNAATDVVNHPGHTLNVDDVVCVLESLGTLFPRPALFKPFAHAGSAAQLWVTSRQRAEPGRRHLLAHEGRRDARLHGGALGPQLFERPAQMHARRFYDSTFTNGRIQLSAKASGRVTADVYNRARRRHGHGRASPR